MKLRQKLAVVLASAMVVTAVPVVTMATTSNTLTSSTLKVKKDHEFTTTRGANQVRIKFDSKNYGTKQVFYMEVENAEFKEETINGAKDALQEMGLKATWMDKKTVKFEIVDPTTGEEVANDTDLKAVYYAPILAKVTGGDAKVSIKTYALNDITEMAQKVFATTDEKVFKYSVGDKTTFYTDNDSKLADLTLEESFIGSLYAVDKDGTADDHKAIITLEINDTDFNFYGYNTADKKEEVFSKGTLLTGDAIELKYGFAGTGLQVYAAMDSKDNGILYIGIDGSSVSSQDSLGKVVLKGLKVDCLVKDPSTGDFLVDIKGDDLTNATDNVVMGEVVKFANYIKMKDDKTVEVTAGRLKEIEFEVGEAVENTMITGRTFEVKLDENAHFDYKGLVKDLSSDYNSETGQVPDLDGDGKANKKDDWRKAAAQIDADKLAEKIIDNYDDWKGVKVEFDKDEDGLAIVDTLVVTVGQAKKDGNWTNTQNNDQKDKIKFKVKACVPVDKKDQEKVMISASGRALENETFETTAMTIKNPLNITTEAATLKVGLKDQVSTGKVVIAETDKEMFMRDGRLYIAIKDKDSGIKITGATFTVDGEIKRVKSDKEDGYVYFDFKRQSNAAATVTVSDITFDVDRTIAEGTYDIEIYGSAICEETKEYSNAPVGHKIKVADFVKIGTPNTQDITAGGLAKGTTTFVIGESKYTSNGIEVTMDAPSYIQDPGYTMVPVRYVAQAFGVAEKDILFGNGTVTIFAGERTLSLTNGSNVAVVNGNTVAMGTKVVIKDGRTYAPAGEIARLLGISTAWDATTKTATFTN